MRWRCLNEKCGHEFQAPEIEPWGKPPNPWHWCPKCRASSRRCDWPLPSALRRSWSGVTDNQTEVGMSYEEKFAAINALGSASLLMRRPGDWYVGQNVEIKHGRILAGKYGNGASPQQAIEDHWRVLTTLEPGEYLVVNAYAPTRRAVRWNGFMWDAVAEDHIGQAA